ncbi:hypothetical protein ABTZ99_13860 [Actinosynnema sp. NPDC002837]
MRRLMGTAAGVAALVLASLTVLPGTAQAATGTGYTSPSYYGNASFNTSTGRLTVNDTYGDSRRVVSSVWNLSLGGLHIVSGEDANGSNGTPGYAYASGGYAPGDRLEIEVCRRNGPTATPTNCDSGYVTVN